MGMIIPYLDVEHTHTPLKQPPAKCDLLLNTLESQFHTGELQKVRNLQRNIGPIHHQEPRYSNRCKKMK